MIKRLKAVFRSLLRDYFAAKALQNIMSDPDPRREPYTNDQLAQFSYEIANAMLAERERRQR